MQERSRFPIWLTLFFVFLKIGAFTFGGGYAMIPIVQREVVTRQHWLDDEAMLDVIAIAESTPGPIAINTATFVGYKMGGFWGSVCATLGISLPSLIIIYVISLFYQPFMQNEFVQHAFQGILSAVALFLFSAVFRLGKTVRTHRVPVVTSLLSVVSLLLVFWTDLSAITLILGAGIFGLLFLSPPAKEEKKS